VRAQTQEVLAKLDSQGKAAGAPAASVLLQKFKAAPIDLGQRLQRAASDDFW
jgi:hypothetical protein